MAIGVPMRDGSSEERQSPAHARIRRSGRILKLQIAALCALMSIVVCVVVAAAIVEQRKAALDRAWNDAANVSAAFEEQVRLVLNNVSGAMDLVKEHIERDGPKFDLSQWTKQVPQLAASTIQVAIIGSDGKLVASTLERNPKPVDLSDREHFKVHRENPNAGFFIGKPVRGRVSGQVTIQATKRLTAPDGGFGGVIVFSLDPEMLTTLHKQIDFGKNGTLTLVGTDGIVRARLGSTHVMDQTVVGTNISNATTMLAAAHADSGRHISRSVVDKVERLFDWRKVRGYPLIVSIGLSMEEAVAGASRHAVMVLMLGGVAVVLPLIMVLILNREISRRVEHEIALADEGTKLHDVYTSLAAQHGELLATSAALDSERQKLEEVNAALKFAKQRAEEASEAKSRFLANMSHELRTPLNGVLGMAQALAAQKLGPVEEDMVAAITDSSDTLMAIINDILDLSKIEAGKIEIAPVNADLRHCLAMLHKLFLPRAEEKRIHFTLNMDGGIPPLMQFDPVRVRQCVSNLISNAIKFTEQGGVEISAISERLPDGNFRVVVDVTDTGIGMDEAVCGKLFSAFTQANSTTTRRFGGTGLGLAITRKLATLMDGDVSVRSAPGEGSTFSFVFFAAPAQFEISAADQEPAPINLAELAGLRVLAVDDNAINRKVVHVFLEPQGVYVSDAANGREALDKLASEPFDLVLLDVHMPIMDGAETIARIRESGELWAPITVMALTADALPGDRERFLDMGMNGYLAKPLDQRELLAKISTLMAAAKGGDRKMADRASPADRRPRRAS
jgi:signal transduction histidine kinase/AmiR/NasT family two-component response regulator